MKKLLLIAAILGLASGELRCQEVNASTMAANFQSGAQNLLQSTATAASADTARIEDRYFLQQARIYQDILRMFLKM